MNSGNYQDYVFKNGQFVGDFEGMYAKSKELPWHQDRTAKEIFSELDVTILRSLHQRNTYRKAADLGCGLGYLTQRFNTEALVSPPCEIFGFDFSPTAVRSCQKKFPDIQFDTLDLTSIPPVELHNKFDLVIIGNCIWYLLNELEAFLECADLICSKHLYFFNSFPSSKPYHGDHLFPNAQAIPDWFEKSGSWKTAYQCIEKDANYNGREYLHLLMSKPN